MTNKEIIKCLKSYKEISDFELIETNRKSKELFYVLKRLEMNRTVDVKTRNVTIYVQKDGKIGSSNISILACDDIASLNKKIESAILKAKTVLNKYYELPKNEVSIDDANKKFDLDEIASKLSKIVFRIKDDPNGWINSTEIFVSEINKEFISSNNIHHKSKSLQIQIEIVPTYKNGDEEFEQYRLYESNVPNYKEIERKVKGILTKAKLRSSAKTLKEVKLPKDIKVLVKNDMIISLMDNFKDNLSYAEVFTGTSHYKLGDTLSNNKFTMTLKQNAKGCYASRSFDSHGVNLKNKTIVKDGRVIAYWGDPKYGYYLNEKKISGDLPLVEVKAKGVDFEKEKHLIIETFSSPQLDETSGYFGGEVRLARYFDGEKYIPLTGLSISGNIYKDIKDVAFSNRIVTLNNYKGPKYMIFKGLNVH